MTRISGQEIRFYRFIPPISGRTLRGEAWNTSSTPLQRNIELKRRGQSPFTLGAVVALGISVFAAGWAVQGFRHATGALRAATGDFSSGTLRANGIVPAANVGKDDRVFGEFEHQDALLLGANELVQYHQQTLVEIVRAIHDKIRVIGVVATKQQQADVIALLKQNDLPANSLEFFSWPVEAMWVRDYAPYFMVGKQLTLIDFAYPEANRDMEDQFAMAMASAYGFHYDHSQLTLEGGNLISNGRGVCISTNKVTEQNAFRGDNEQRIGELLHQHFHFERWIRLQPLDGEPTGHADMFFAMCAPNKCIVGLYTEEDDRVNAKLLDDNASILKGEDSGLKDADGKPVPMEVERLRMPSHADGNWRSYTNVIYANGTLLVPQYPQTSPELDKVALETFRDAMPGWNVIGIDCEGLIAKRGALHCISRQVPQLPTGK